MFRSTLRRLAAAGALALLALPLAAVSPSAAATTDLAPGDLVVRTADGRLVRYAHSAGASTPWSETGSTVVGTGWAGANSLAVTDVSLDGRPDLFDRMGDSIGYHAHRGEADPIWDVGERVFGMSGWADVPQVVLEDFNRDGRPDLMARQPGGNLRMWEHDGNQTASPWLTRPARDIAYGLERADTVLFGEVTRDDFRDLVMREDDGNLWIVPHPGDSSAAARSAGGGVTWDLDALRARAETASAARTAEVDPTLPYELGFGWADFASLAVADVTGDGLGDLLALEDSGRLWIYPHNGATVGQRPWTDRIDAGSWWGGDSLLAVTDAPVTQEPPDPPDPEPDPDPVPVRPGDAVALDRDGRLWRLWHTGDRDRPWARSAASVVGADWSGADVFVLDDVTLDGRPDLFFRDPAGDGSVWFHPHQGDDTAPWAIGEKVFGMSGWNNAAAVLLEDVNHDERPDLLSRMPAGNLRVWLHDGKTTSSPWLSAGNWTDVALGLQGTDVVRFGELTGDDARDLIIREADGSLWVLPASGAEIGPGTPPVWTWDLAAARANADPADPSLPYELGGGWADADQLEVQDVDGDGRSDLLAVGSDGALTIYYHDGSPAGRNPWTVPTPAGDWWGRYALVGFSSLTATAEPEPTGRVAYDPVGTAKFQTLTAAGFRPGEPVTHSLDGRPESIVRANQEGEVAFVFKAPTRGGDYASDLQAASGARLHVAFRVVKGSPGGSRADLLAWREAWSPERP
ncbi:FG-GAP repeat domain-containing protein [Microlunatus speluncae]|uniref:FG-GAP repeat domain-containing protein n=1 Tax=Microlunatus speluncae TaxID=2594267 RepID=UPI0012666EAD|nr:VCBS repeat-containing protein [Microlunatus speluncae]